MDGRAQGLVRILAQLVERATQGPLPDERKVIANLRYIREQLEIVFRRYSVVQEGADHEAIRQKMAEAIQSLYGGLEELEAGILHNEQDRLEPARGQIAAALFALEQLEQSIEDQEGMAQDTL